ncbi:MAG: class I adenylate-forming enzyme family protein [Pseudomonadota bacterium]|nr:class I adenylate-forming enzyme family protein [Pseudomonadota bacterium]
MGQGFSRQLTDLCKLAASSAGDATSMPLECLAGPGAWRAGLLRALLPGRPVIACFREAERAVVARWRADHWPDDLDHRFVGDDWTEPPGPDGGDTDLPLSAGCRVLVDPAARLEPEHSHAVTADGVTIQLDPLDLAIVFWSGTGRSVAEIAPKVFAPADEIIVRLDRLRRAGLLCMAPVERCFVRWFWTATRDRFAPAPEDEPLPALLQRQARTRPAALAVTTPDGDELTFGDALARARDAARSLLARGLRPGDRVGVLAAQQPDLFLAAWATWIAGLVLVPVGLDFPQAAFTRLAAQTGMKCLVADAGHCPPDLPDGLELVGIGTEPVPGMVARLSNLPPAPSVRLPDLSGDDIATILLTSGSTGIAKQVAHTHRNMQAMTCSYAGSLGMHATDRLFAPMSATDVTGFQYFFLIPAFCGAAIVAMGAPAPGHALRSLETMAEARPTILYSYPVLLDQMLDAAATRGLAVADSLRIVNSGGALIDGPAKLRYARGFGAQVVVGLGMTESISLVRDWVEPADQDADDSVGRPFWSWLQLRDENGALVGDGEIGRLWILDDRSMAGYLVDGALQPKGADSHGWLAGSDILRRDTTGRYFVIGRADDFINLGSGEKVYLATIEACLDEHPGVAATAVLAETAEGGGDTTVAFWQGRDSEHPTENELRRHVRARMGATFVPGRFVRLAALPRNTRGKIDRAALQAVLSTGPAAPGRT